MIKLASKAGRANRMGLLMTGALVIAGLGTGVGAQTAGDGASDLNLPRDITIFGNADPQVRKATAIVNNVIITDTDVEQRLALVLAANGGETKVEGEERERLKLQVLRNLIDETLQIQEAKANDITITAGEIDQTFSRVASNFKRKPAEFAQYLRAKGSSEASIRRQIEGELAWRRLLGRRVEPFVNVGEEEVRGVMDRLNAAKGQTEYHVMEIFLSATPETHDSVLANANRMIEQIRQGGSFQAYAQQYSEASTKAVGGDLDWLRAEQLPDPLANAVREMQRGQISAPIDVPGGISIVALRDTRQVLAADPRDAVLALKQIAITFPAGTTQAVAAPQVKAFGDGLRTINGCGTANDIAAKLHAEVVDNDQVRVRDLPAPLQDLLLKLSVGQATPPFGSIADGVRGLVLCGRDEAKANDGPSFEQIQQQIEGERVNKRAQRYLRDLRRDAVIEYR